MILSTPAPVDGTRAKEYAVRLGALGRGGCVVRSWMMVVSLLGSATLGCNTPCDSPVPVYCCPDACRTDVGVPATCGPAGWTCPAGSVLPSQCPSGLVCGGPATDGGLP